jgi:hypothetical protein
MSYIRYTVKWSSFMKPYELLIIGRKPLPIGGVTVHVERLCSSLEQKSFNFYFADPSKSKFLDLLYKIARSKIVHIHASNPLLILMIGFWAKIVRTLCVFTLHGNFARYQGLKGQLLDLAIKISDIPITLNQETYESVREINPAARLISSFIPPLQKELLNDEISIEIRRRAVNMSLVIISNAYDVAFDVCNKETYGISALIDYFSRKDCLLIISDPSGNYEKFIKRRFSSKSLTNVFFISRPHSFYSALAFADVFIRNTTTDGDSLSIHEALYLGKPVWATDCVTRPSGTNLYKNLVEVQFGKYNKKNYDPPQVVDELVCLYRDLLNEIKKKTADNSRT